MKKIYVGNIPWRATEDDLREYFGAYGEVSSVAIILDRETGRSRGFGFVEMEDQGADRAIAEADGKDYQGRPLRVNEAQQRDRGDRGDRGGDRGDRGGGGGGGGRPRY